jgi:hypothetical protein
MVYPCRCGHEKGDHQMRIGQRGNYTPCCISGCQCDGFRKQGDHEMAFKRIKVTDDEKPVKLTLAGKRIRRKLYGVGRCYVAGKSVIAVKAGRAKLIGTRGMVLNFLTEHGLSLREARTFVREGLDLSVMQQELASLCESGLPLR